MSEKAAAPIASFFRNMGQRALASGGLASVYGTAGAGVGALVGGAKGYRKAKEEGGSGIAGALRGGTRGAATGGMLGAAAGAVGGAVGGSKAQQMVQILSSKESPVKSISRFGERQVHSLTGAAPKGGLSSIGASPAEDAYKAWKAAKDSVGVGAAATKDKTVGSLAKAYKHAKDTEALGMTSLPGAAKAFATHPLQAAKAGLGREWHGNPSVTGKLMAFGLPGAMVVNDAMRNDDPNSTKASRGLASLGMMAPFSMTPMGFTGATAASTILGSAGSRAGKLLSKKKLGQNPSPPVLDDGAVSGGVERVLSPRASGDVGQ